MRNAGIAGTIVDVRFGGVAAYNHYDTRMEAYIDGVYDAQYNTGGAEVGFRIEKKATDNTFFGLGLGVQIPQHTRDGNPAYPIVSVYTGFTM
jgi:hypothetical protein